MKKNSLKSVLSNAKTLAEHWRAFMRRKFHALQEIRTSTMVQSPEESIQNSIDSLLISRATFIDVVETFASFEALDSLRVLVSIVARRK